MSSWNPAKAKNLFAGHTVHAIVLEVPDNQLLSVVKADRRIHAWGLTSLATDAGGWRPINRAGHPMIHPLFTQLEEKLGDQLNATRPADDVSKYAKTIADDAKPTARFPYVPMPG